MIRIVLPLFLITAGFTLFSLETFPEVDYPDQNHFDEKGVAVVYHGRRDLKHIALTIDDGWVPDYELIHFLEREQVSCTVFIPGKLMVLRPEWIAEMDMLGFEIGSHGFSHKLLPFLSREEQIQELKNTNQILEEITGKTTQLVRPSGGRLDGPHPSLELIREQGYTIVLWDNDIRGYSKQESVEDQLNWLWDHLQPGNIILGHFGDSLNTREVLEIWIPLVREMGYEFVTLSELIGELEEGVIQTLPD